MKRSLLLILFIISLSLSCQNEAEKMYKTYQDAKDKEVSSGVKKDTIFMDFVLGMTEAAYFKHADELVLKGKLWLDTNYPSVKVYTFDLTFPMSDGVNGSYESSTKIVPMITHDDKLYQLLVSYKLKPYSSAALTKALLVGLLAKKYGYDYLKLPKLNKQKADEYDYYWLDGNREIIVFTGDSESAIVSYGDIILKKEVTQRKKEYEKLKNEEVIDDL